MIPGRYDMEVWKGGTFDITLTAKDRDAGSTTDFTKYTHMRMHVKNIWVDQYATDTTPLLELTSENGMISKGDGNLSLLLNIPASTTETLTFTDGRYDLELVVVEAGKEDIVDKFLYGKFTVIGEVTL